MNSLVNAIKNTVPITQFNRGLAGKIFEDVKKQGAKGLILMMWTTKTPK